MMLELGITSPQAERVIDELRCMDNDLSWDPYESLLFKYLSMKIYDVITIITTESDNGNVKKKNPAVTNNNDSSNNSSTFQDSIKQILELHMQ